MLEADNPAEAPSSLSIIHSSPASHLLIIYSILHELNTLPSNIQFVKDTNKKEPVGQLFTR